MNQSEKQTFLVKVQEIEKKIQDLKYWVESLKFDEVTLFDHVEDNALPTNADADSEKKTRRMTTDGSLTASSISYRLSKELGKEISRESIIRLGKQIDAKPFYNDRQHISRYPADAVKRIMDLYRTFNSL